MRPIFALENQRSLTLSLTNIAALIRSGDSSITLRKPRTFYIPMAGCALHRVTSSRRPADYKGCGHSNHSYSEFSSHHQCGFFVSRGEGARGFMVQGSGFMVKVQGARVQEVQGSRSSRVQGGKGRGFQFSIFNISIGAVGRGNYSLLHEEL